MVGEGVTASRAATLAGAHDHGRIREVVRASRNREKPHRAGYIVSALNEGWAVPAATEGQSPKADDDFYASLQGRSN